MKAQFHNSRLTTSRKATAFPFDDEPEGDLGFPRPNEVACRLVVKLYYHFTGDRWLGAITLSYSLVPGATTP